MLDALHGRYFPVHLDVGKNTSSDRYISHPGPLQCFRNQKQGILLQDALCHERELLRRMAPEDFLHLPEHGCGGIFGYDAQPLCPDESEERILGIRNGKGIIGQGHDLALIFQLSHIHQVRDVLEENSREVLAGEDFRRVR